MRFRNVQLINPPLDDRYIASSKAGVYPPTNLVALSSYLKRCAPSVQVSIVDGETISLDGCLRRVGKELVGISANIFTYGNCLKLAQQAKENGAFVVLGGPYASTMAPVILKTRKFVDGVIAGDGERALASLVCDEPLGKIPNLVYRRSHHVLEGGNPNGHFSLRSLRHDEAIIRSPEQEMNLNDLPLPDYDDVDLEPYFTSFRERYPFKPFDGTMAMYSSKGCHWGAKHGRCIYCCIQNPGWRLKRPEVVWRELTHLRSSYGVRFFWDVSDTFTSSKKWLARLLEFKPDDGFHFLVYGRSDDIDEEMASLLKALGVYEVFIGAESGDDRALDAFRKGYQGARSLEAVAVLARHDIKVIFSFVLGAPGEDERSLRSSVLLAEDVRRIGNVSECFSNILLPIPGAPAFDEHVMNSPLRQKYGDADLFDLEEIRRDWAAEFCRVPYRRLEAVRDEISSLFPIQSSFGKPRAAKALATAAQDSR